MAPTPNHPTDATTGLTLPLSKSLDSQALQKQRAMVALELEVMAKKMDRFGWERDRGSAAHDRLMTDWMDVLQDYLLSEVQAACREWVRNNPRKMPNEGDILRLIQASRTAEWQRRKAEMPPKPEKKRERVTGEVSNSILEEYGFAPKRFGGAS
jgi:hypothetical protein